MENNKQEESMEALNVLLELDEKLVFSGLGGGVVTDEDIQRAMKAARRLNQDNLYEFDVTDDVAFMKSVALFMDTFSRMYS